MLKSELIAKLVVEYPHLTGVDAERVVETILDEVTDTLAAGGRVEIRGFGIFTARSRPARPGRNPRTNEAVDIPGKTIPFFKSGKVLRERLQASDTKSPT